MVFMDIDEDCWELFLSTEICMFYYYYFIAELETVKKGTPLYGQPDWWGEDDSNDKGM